MTIDDQIKYHEAILEDLRIDKDGDLPPEEGVMAAEEAIHQTLIAVRQYINMVNVQAKAVTDTTLTGCIEFIRKERQWNNVGLPSMKVFERKKMLDAIEETLCSYQHLVNRMAEQLAELPGNTLKDEKPTGEWVAKDGPEAAPEVVSGPEPAPETVSSDEWDPDELEEKDPANYEPDLMGPNDAERAEELHRIQRDIK